MTPASRVRSIYQKLCKEIPDQPLILAWAHVFGLDPSGRHWEDEVVPCTQALRSEVDLVLKRLGELGVPNGLASPTLGRLKSAAGAASLGTRWGEHSGKLASPEHAITLGWVVWALRDEEELELSDEDRTDILSRLQDAEDAIAAADMSPFLRSFLGQQLSAIRSALHVYPISGAEPLKEALYRAHGSYTVQKKHVDRELALVSEPTKGAIAKATDALDKAATACDKITKIAQFGRSVARVGHSIWEALAGPGG